MAGPNRDLDALFAEGLFESSEALYRALVEQVPAVVYIDSDEQRPDSLYLSPQAEQLFGYPPSAYLADAELWRDNTHPDDRPFVAESWRRARAAGGPFECEYRIRHRDGGGFRGWRSGPPPPHGRSRPWGWCWPSGWAAVDPPAKWGA